MRRAAPKLACLPDLLPVRRPDVDALLAVAAAAATALLPATGPCSSGAAVGPSAGSGTSGSYSGQGGAVVKSSSGASGLVMAPPSLPVWPPGAWLAPAGPAGGGGGASDELRHREAAALALCRSLPEVQARRLAKGEGMGVAATAIVAKWVARVVSLVESTAVAGDNATVEDEREVRRGCNPPCNPKMSISVTYATSVTSGDSRRMSESEVRVLEHHLL